MNARHSAALAAPPASAALAAPLAVNRLESIQILRGIAAMMVVFHHAGRYLALAPQFEPGQSHLVPSPVVALMGATGGDLFFVISGFVMALSARRFVGVAGAGVFLLQRFIRIAPLFYLASLLMLAATLRAGTPIETASILNSITFIPVFDDDTYSWPLHYLGWTLAFEFVFYLVVAVLIAAGKGGNHMMLLVITASLPLAGFVFHGAPIVWKVITNGLVWEFALGVVACMLWERRGLERLRYPFAAGLALALVACVVAMWQEPAYLMALNKDPVEGATTARRAWFWGVPAFFLFCLVVGARPPGDGPAARLLKLLGDASYSIYLSHLFVIMFVGALIRRLPFHPDLVVLATLAISAVFGVVVYRLAEKPMLTEGQRRIRGWSLRHMRATS